MSVETIIKKKSGPENGSAPQVVAEKKVESVTAPEALTPKQIIAEQSKNFTMTTECLKEEKAVVGPSKDQTNTASHVSSPTNQAPVSLKTKVNYQTPSSPEVKIFPPKKTKPVQSREEGIAKTAETNISTFAKLPIQNPKPVKLDPMSNNLPPPTAVSQPVAVSVPRGVLPTGSEVVAVVCHFDTPTILYICPITSCLIVTGYLIPQYYAMF